jgi:ParB family chromosome partitioning protein
VKSGGLGRGLDALIGISSHEEKTLGVVELDINKIEPNRKQPRKNFDPETLRELANSIKEVGIIQPLIVKDEGDYYSIIAGERRWRAARLAELLTVPALVKNYSNSEIFQVALIENLQREDLNPIEEATGYRRLAEEFLLNQDDIADRVGKKRGRVAAYLALLKLDERVQAMVAEGKLSPTHGRRLALMKRPEAQFEAAVICVEERLTVSELEKLVGDYEYEAELDEEETPDAEREQTETRLRKEEREELHYGDLRERLESRLSAKTIIKNKKNGSGRLEIYYDSPEEFGRIFEILTGN